MSFLAKHFHSSSNRMRSVDAARKRKLRSTLQFETMEPRQLLAGDPVIAEFMASNDTTLADGNGNFPDWIEVFNQGDAAVDLTGWHLTDNAIDLTKWTFPDVALPAGGHLVVFASGNDAPDSGGNLHTNFSLSAGGEYLALVQPDGMTIATQFQPEFTQQITDISFGIPNQATESSFVSQDSPGKVLVPTAPVVGDWTGGNAAFDDSAWLDVTTDIGFSGAVIEHDNPTVIDFSSQYDGTTYAATNLVDDIIGAAGDWAANGFGPNYVDLDLETPL